MSHFYGSIKGNRGEATRCGAKRGGYRAVAAGWQGAIETMLYHNDSDDTDYFVVHMIPWGVSGGGPVTLARGKLDCEAFSKQRELVSLTVTAEQAYQLAKVYMTED